jgi:hypothetical protein
MLFTESIEDVCNAKLFIEKRRSKMAMGFIDVKIEALYIRGEIAEIPGFKGNFFLQKADERISDLIEGIENKKWPTIFVAMSELSAIGYKILRGIEDVDSSNGDYDYLFWPIQKIREKMLTSNY